MKTTKGDNTQQNWFALCKHFNESHNNCPKTRKYLAERLREAAEHIETNGSARNGWPDIYGVSVALPGEFMEGTNAVKSAELGRPIPNLMGEIIVWFSHPWPG